MSINIKKDSIWTTRKGRKAFVDSVSGNVVKFKYWYGGALRKHQMKVDEFMENYPRCKTKETLSAYIK